jgi:hypothetical protein
MAVPGQRLEGQVLGVARAFDIETVRTRVAAAEGGYEVVVVGAGGHEHRVPLAYPRPVGLPRRAPAALEDTIFEKSPR